MIGPKTARNGAVLLATGIAETLEDNAHVAARFNAAPDPAAAGTRLYLAAHDIMALAAALRVLTRPLPDIDGTGIGVVQVRRTRWAILCKRRCGSAVVAGQAPAARRPRNIQARL